MPSEEQEEGKERGSGYCYTACCHGDTNTKLNGKDTAWENGSSEDNARCGFEAMARCVCI